MLLLKESRNLINQGIERRFIRLRGNSLYSISTKSYVALCKTLNFVVPLNRIILGISFLWIQILPELKALQLKSQTD